MFFMKYQERYSKVNLKVFIKYSRLAMIIKARERKENWFSYFY